MIRTYKYRLYPSKAQGTRLDETLALCCELYNAGLQERRDAWALEWKSISYIDQQNQLPGTKEARPDVGTIHSQVLQDVLRRLDKAFQGFFRRVKEGVKNPGFPRFRSHTRYDSFTYPQGGFSFKDGKLSLSKVGKVRIKLHRPIEGKIKTLTVRREAGNWYACFTAECEVAPLPATDTSVGVDVGLCAFATLSDGTKIENPRYYEKAQGKLRRVQRKIARRKKGSNRRRKAVRLLQRVHAHTRNQRADFHHKVSRRLVKCYGIIAVEDLNVVGLARGMLAKSVTDAGWASFISKLTYKAEEAGRQLMKVNPRGTSQTCLCGADVPKTLKERRHECSACGLSADRDYVSAQLILGLGLSLQALTCPVTESVA